MHGRKSERFTFELTILRKMTMLLNLWFITKAGTRVCVCAWCYEFTVMRANLHNALYPSYSWEECKSQGNVALLDIATDNTTAVFNALASHLTGSLNSLILWSYEDICRMCRKARSRNIKITADLGYLLKAVYYTKSCHRKKNNLPHKLHCI